MEKIQTLPWDPAEHLETEEDMAAYLNVALEDGDPRLIMAVLGDIARARRMGSVAQNADTGRENIYKSLSLEPQPRIRHSDQGSARLGISASRYRRDKRMSDVSRRLATVRHFRVGRLLTHDLRLARHTSDVQSHVCNRTCENPAELIRLC